MLYVHDFTKGLWLNTIVYNQNIKTLSLQNRKGFLFLGPMAERRGTGLQNRLHQFKSGWDL